jgi:hypothetical protein
MSNARINLFWLIIFTCTLPLAVVLSTHLARRSFEEVKFRDQTIRVKGYAELPITSDLAQWVATFTVRDADRTTAYRQIEAQRGLVTAFLAERGFTEQKITLSPVTIRPVYVKNDEGKNTNQIERYDLSQAVSLSSADVDAVARIAREVSGLIGKGIELSAAAPRYLYTRLDDTKLRMISEATANARERAQRLVAGSGNTLGPLRSASQGVFQITPAFSNEVSDYGYNDTTSRDKIIKAVVTVEYGIM